MFDRPVVLYMLLLLIPALFIAVAHFRRLIKVFFGSCAASDERTRVVQRFVVRTVLWSCAWIFLVVAAAGPFWGEEPVPVQKNGNSVSFVFDVSYSMLAPDMENGASRLAASASYASQLLQYMNGTSVSVVLAKGSGILAVPQTSDFAVIRSLLAKLSPTLLSAPGSNLASGVQAAVRSFPNVSADTSTIVLFTDGDETISSLKSAVQDAVQYGISVMIIGFGNTAETEVRTGGGQTAMSALREKELLEMCASVQSSFAKKHKLLSDEKLLYVNAQNPSSAVKVLSTLTFVNRKDENGTVTLYEIKPVPRFRLFLLLAVVCFAVGFVAAEFRTARRGKKSLTYLMCVCTSLLFFSCSGHSRTAAEILTGVLYWGQKDYQQAEAAFLMAEDSAAMLNDESGALYASFGLASSYLMQNETEAALNRLAALEDVSPSLIQFGSLYNSGIIFYQNGDYEAAADYFKRALLVDSQNLNAKINLELSMNHITVQSSAAQQELIPFQDSESAAAQENIFSVIRENDGNQWKNQKQEESDILDY